jgi:hypothetical protein
MRPGRGGGHTGQRSRAHALDSRGTGGPTQWVLGALPSRVKRLWREAYHSPPSKDEVKNMWNYTPFPPHTSSWRAPCSRLLPVSYHGYMGSIPVTSCEICGEQCAIVAGFLRVLLFPLSILTPPTASYSLILLSYDATMSPYGRRR